MQLMKGWFEMAEKQNVIGQRYDFVYLFDVKYGNPNGDPDAGNQPRVDPETGLGLVTDVCLKRKIRDFVTVRKADNGGLPEGYWIYVQHQSRGGVALNVQHQKAHDALGKGKGKKKLSEREKTELCRQWMCEKFYDIRTFGAVMTTGVNCGQVRGPVQLAFARSIDPVLPLETTITRVAYTRAEKAEATTATTEMGRKNLIPYGLYRGHGFISPHFARDTGFSEDDLELLWEALVNMFELDRSASRGEMAARRLVVFEHQSPLGNAPAHKLFDMIGVSRVDGSKPPRDFSDYEVTAPGAADLPKGVRMLDKL